MDMCSRCIGGVTGMHVTHSPYVDNEAAGIWNTRIEGVVMVGIWNRRIEGVVMAAGNDFVHKWCYVYLQAGPSPLG